MVIARRYPSTPPRPAPPRSPLEPLQPSLYPPPIPVVSSDQVFASILVPGGVPRDPPVIRSGKEGSLLTHERGTSTKRERERERELAEELARAYIVHYPRELARNAGAFQSACSYSSTVDEIAEFPASIITPRDVIIAASQAPQCGIGIGDEESCSLFVTSRKSRDSAGRR